jgi:hypothetical protein
MYVHACAYAILRTYVERIETYKHLSIWSQAYDFQIYNHNAGV